MAKKKVTIQKEKWNKIEKKNISKTRKNGVMKRILSKVENKTKIDENMKQTRKTSGKEKEEDQSGPTENIMKGNGKKKMSMRAEMEKIRHELDPDIVNTNNAETDKKETKIKEREDQLKSCGDKREDSIETRVRKKTRNVDNNIKQKQEAQTETVADKDDNEHSKKVGESIYPRTCTDCLSIYGSKFTYYKHKKLGRCHKKKVKLQHEKRRTVVKKCGEKKNTKGSNVVEKKRTNIESEINESLNSEDEHDCDKDEIIRDLKKQIANMNKEKCWCKSHKIPIGIESDFFEIRSVKEEVVDTEHSSHSCDMKSAVYLDSLDQEITNLSMSIYPRHCDNCENVYKNETTFNKHLVNCKSNEKTSCPNCEKTLESDKAYFGHIKRCNRSRILSNLATLASLGEEFSEEEDEENFAALFPSMSKPHLLITSFFQCHHCSTMYLSKVTFLIHLKNKICGNKSKRISCIYDDCDIKFTRYDHLLLHLPHYHNDNSYISKTKYFRTLTSFEKWKADDQNERFSYLVKSRGTKTYKGTEYMYYECQFNSICDGKRGAERKTKRRKKAGLIPHLFCPARMSILRDIASGIICVNYIPKHSHRLSYEDVKYQRFPKSVVNHILAELRKGAKPRDIFEFYHEDNYVVNSDGIHVIENDLKMNHLISLKFIKYLKRKLTKMNEPEDSIVAEKEHYEVKYIENTGEYEMVPIPIPDDDIEDSKDPEVITLSENIDSKGNIIKVVMFKEDDEVS